MKSTVFQPIDLSAENSFQPYQGRYQFGDQSYSLLYAWGEEFRYQYAKSESGLVISENNRGRGTDFFVLRKEADAPLMDALKLISQQVREGEGTNVNIKYIGENELPDYLTAAQALGYSITYAYDEKDSDYIYWKDEFITLSGGKKKSIRGDYNYLLREGAPNLHYETYRPERLVHCMEIFEQWCQAHDCAKCCYGCEKKAFQRFMEVFREDRCFAALSYNGEEPISFAAGEIINETTASYYFQKNKRPIRGLTYWLNREIAQSQPQIAFINLAEDMGLEGIRQDKQQLHPCWLQKKYTATLIMG